MQLLSIVETRLAWQPTLSANSRLSSEVMILLGVIVGLGVLMGVVAMVLRRKLVVRDESPPLGFTLSDLRRLHAEGQISDEELAAAEERTLSRSRSHYLGNAGEEPAMLNLDESSTNDPPLEGPEAENDSDAADKNGGG